jgi:hypothetical protein
VGTAEEKESSVAARSIKEAAENPSAPIRVKVNEPYRVLHEGKPFVGGDVLDVPDDAEHRAWLQSGWVTKEK